MYDVTRAARKRSRPDTGIPYTIRRRTLRLLRVRARPGDHRRGILTAPNLTLPCALGRGGIVVAKREGDGGTPRGRFRLLALFHRPGPPRPSSMLRAVALTPDLGWCDAPTHRAYNRPVRLPFPASHERMWRDDPLYDLVIDIDWNRRVVRQGRGSAIFMHVARAGFAPTEGCVALRLADLRRLVARLGPGTRIDIR